MVDEPANQVESGTSSQAEPNVDVNRMLSESLTTLTEATKKCQTFQVQRDYHLSPKGDSNIWFDNLKSELNSNNLLDNPLIKRIPKSRR